MLFHLREFLESRRLGLDPLFLQVDKYKSGNVSVEEFKDLLLN